MLTRGLRDVVFYYTSLHSQAIIEPHLWCSTQDDADHHGATSCVNSNRYTARLYKRMVHISLNSNLSNESIQLTPISIGDNYGEFELCFKGQDWESEHDHSIRLTSDLIILSCDTIRSLVQSIEKWLQHGDPDRYPFNGEFTLAADTSDAQFNLIFAERPDTISPAEKSVVTAKFRFGRLSGEFSFVSDQSCLRLFASALNKTLAESGKQT